ncbi:PqqD family protein [Marinilabilia sp.]|uniref:PqqD family protein n=1 Tax=Marinilabilia sp. TaxID=2021252 RepID=UPI0025B911E6|nr:PqqD family protein [Marinilabilia sp.]
MDKQRVLYRLNAEQFVTRQMGSEMVMVPLTDKVADMTSVLTLNEVGADILKILENPKTIEEMTENLFTLYDVDKATLEADIDDFLKTAIDKKVVEIINQERF